MSRNKQRDAALFAFDAKYRKKGQKRIAGIDEAGRGPLAGPVVAGAVVFAKNVRIEGLNDSKQLTPKSRERLFWEILCKAEDFGVGVVDETVIDKINILRAARLAMEEAVFDLKVLPDFLLIDGINLTKINVKQAAFVKGDTMSASIAAASILAKVVRDRLMIGYDDRYPMYGFKTHKGYPTKKHIENIKLYGPCEIHRKTFAPIRNLPLPYK